MIFEHKREQKASQSQSNVFVSKSKSQLFIQLLILQQSIL